jgi:hypothetical protein
MPDIEPATRPTNPARIVTDAILAAVDKHLKVSSNPDLGVHCTSTYAPGWEVDPRASAISPLGAVLLARQPEINEPIAALVHALGVGFMWQEGFDHGCAADALNENHLAGLDRDLYRDGYKVGAEARVLLNRIRQRTAEVAAEPGKILDTLIDSLRVSDVLDKLAAGQRKRAAALVGAAKEFHEGAAKDLADIAQCFRDDGL